MADPALDRLAARAADGDDEALGAWFEAERTPVYRLCLGFLAHVQDAEDAAQEALLRLHDNLCDRDPQRPYTPWRNSVVLNLCRDRRRSDQRRRDREADRDHPSDGVLPDPSDVAEAAECAQALARALSALPPREREVFVLVDLDRRDATEVGALLEIKPGTVRATLALARTRLGEAIGAVLPRRYARGGGA
ncbi:MAG: sigma-70 family RNA polymerase sigma factor [Planctomycetota bacterium]